MPKLSLHIRIFISMFIGLAIGLVMHFGMDPESFVFDRAVWFFDLVGKDVFVGGLKFIIAPLILASIITGIVSLPSAQELGNIGFKTLGYYVGTTTLAATIGVIAVLVIQPGKKEASQVVREDREQQIAQAAADFQDRTGLDPASPEGKREFVMDLAQSSGADLSGGDFASKWTRMQSTQTRGPGDMFREEIIRPILSNPFNALSKNPPNSLGVIFFAIVVGLACILIGEPAAPVATFFKAFNGVMMKITMWIMELAPWGIGCIIASLVATLGMDALRSLAWYCVTVVGGIGVHICVILMLVKFVGRMSPLEFIKGLRDALLIAFTTTSSAATLPVTIHCVTKKLKVSEKVADFTLPVGATVNMDGTALYEGVAVIFLIQLFGGLADVPIELTFMKTLIIFLTAVLASIGAAAVPSAGLITMAIVASAVGLPLYYVFFIYAVDHLLDMFRTSTNVMGDAAGAVIVNRLEANNLGEET